MLKDRESIAGGPVFRFGALRTDKLRAVGDLRRTCTKGATFVQSSRKLTSRDHVERLRGFYCFDGDRRALAMAEADHADA